MEKPGENKTEGFLCNSTSGGESWQTVHLAFLVASNTSPIQSTLS